MSVPESSTGPSSGPSAGSLAEPGELPPTVARGVRLMYAGAVLSGIAIALGIWELNALRDSMRGQFLVSDAALDSAVWQEMLRTIVRGFVAGVLWLWMAWKCREGRGWARVASSVFFGVFTIAFVVLVADGQSGTLDILVTVATWLVGLGALILVWSKRSRGHFAARAKAYDRSEPTFL